MSLTPLDRRTFYTALGFTAVIILGGKLNPKNRAARALTIARLMEEFCELHENASAYGPDSPQAHDLDAKIEEIKAALRQDGAAHLPESRPDLLAFYDRLLHRRERRAQSAFYATAHEDMIANACLSMIDAEITDDETRQDNQPGDEPS